MMGTSTLRPARPESRRVLRAGRAGRGIHPGAGGQPPPSEARGGEANRLGPIQPARAILRRGASGRIRVAPRSNPPLKSGGFFFVPGGPPAAGAVAGASRRVTSMLDLKWIREHPEETRAALARRGEEALPSIDELLRLDEERRRLLATVEEKKAYRNRVSQEIGRARQAGEDVADRMQAMRELGETIRALDEQVKAVEAQIEERLLQIPNLPHESIPTGPDETANQEIRRWGEPPRFAFEPKPHWELGPRLGILDFERAAKITGARFARYWGAGARLERALISFMLDLHTQEHGYTEVFPPFLVNRAAMIGTGQLPKFEEDMFKCEGTDYYLIPTAEVPVTNLHAGEILAADQLPLRYTAYTACFRAEAGSAGRDTRGLIRNHQFDKVELVK